MRPLRLLSLAAALSFVLAAPACAAAAPACAPVALTPARAVAPSIARAGPVTLQGLLGLRDLKGFAVSPDGRWTFLVEQRAQPAENRYATRWLLAPADCSGPPVAVDTLGRPPAFRFYGTVHGFVPVEAPAWSPDGRWVAYRKETGDQLELWILDVRRRTVRRVPTGGADVERFAWSADSRLMFQTGLNRSLFAARMAAEQAHGFLYDDRFNVASGAFQPMPPDCAVSRADPACENRLRVADPAVPAGPRDPTSSEAAAWRDLGDPAKALGARGARDVSRGPGGDHLWAETVDPDRNTGPKPPLRVRTDRAGAPPCTAAACAGAIEGVWPAGSPGEVVFARRESSATTADDAPQDLVSLYRWQLATGAVTRVLTTSDALNGCAPAGGGLYCLLETSRTPARIVRIDPDRGRAAVVYDPNPGFGAGPDITLQKVVYTDELGYRGFYYVVRRADLDPHRRHPAVVVQYQARGFLRGGTGDEYPIYPLAEQGFVVVAVDQAWRPLKVASAPTMSAEMVERGARAHSLEAAIDRLVAQGLVDPARVALTGLSSGAETLHYALQHTDRYATAIASSGPVEMDFLVLTAPLYSNFKAKYEATSVLPRGGPLAALAWGPQPEKLKTPLLVNVNQREFLWGLEGFAALRDAGRPLEVRVFADRGRHMKYDPANRAAVYALNLQWLEFWLQGRRSDDPALAPQYARWAQMQAQLRAERAASGASAATARAP